MGTPSVSISKNTFTTGQAPASAVGVLAIVAASSTGTQNLPGGYSRSDLAINDYGYGPLTDFAAYDIAVANNQAVLCKGNATYAGSYVTSVVKTGTGTASITPAGAPFDHYNVLIVWVAGATVGTSGATYTYSLDGGNTVSGPQSLGTASTLTIPNTGVSFTIGTGAIVAGDTWQIFTERPLLGDTDVLASLTALSNSRIPWEGALVDCSATTSTVGLVDTFLAGLEARGIFKFVIINTPFKLEPEPSAETESAYAARITTLVQNQTSIRMCVGADGAHIPSQITAWNLKRPTSLALAARAMRIPLGEDPAYVGRGAVFGAQVSDNQGNPFDHDEDLYPNLDGLRLTTLRSFAPGGPQGVYITNANTIQPSGGSFPYLQHIRIMNRACQVAWFVLTTQLSKGVRKNPKADPVTGKVYIFEPDAAAIESLVNAAVQSDLGTQVSGVKFSLSRTDDMNAIPVKVNGLLSIVAQAYIKDILVQAQFNKTLQTAP